MRKRKSMLFQAVDGSVTTPQGFSAGGLHCGLKLHGRPDLGAILCDVPAAAAAVYTRNAFQAAPIAVTKESLGVDGRLQVVVVNSGNANACTGEEGLADARRMRELAAQAFGVREHHVAVASTGVIGVRLDMERVREGIERLPQAMDKAGGIAFCRAIMTTDLVKKEACAAVEVDGRTVYVAGAAKGSGMIHPDMATMLGFLTTDAAIDRAALSRLLVGVVDETFNMITVDGDTSTNDMVTVMASGLAGNRPLDEEHRDWPAFAAAFRHVCQTLAKAIVRDGEGATKLIEVCVKGAESSRAARVIARTVASSNLVKTACYGADANWGRIIAAVGRSGQPVRTDAVDVWLGNIPVLIGSRPVAFDEERARAYLERGFVRIIVNLHMGKGRATAWGCDLTHDYININASYRT